MGTCSAENTARRYLGEALPRRWAHVRQVAARAERMADALAENDGKLLCMAAWLHHVGYAHPPWWKRGSTRLMAHDFYGGLGHRNA